MTNSREIKKALTRAFKGVKFSVTTENVLCETITVKWTGYPFINEVKTITDAWNTYQDHSDSMTDYFHYTGTEIKFERSLSEDEADFLSVGILQSVVGYNRVDGNAIVWNSKYQYFEMEKDNFRSWDDTREVNQLLRDWKENGLATSLEDSPQAQESAYQAKLQKEEEERLEFESNLLPLIQGDYAGTPANDNLNYIVIHWHEGIQTIKEEAKFSSFKSANDAIRKIFDQTSMEWKEDGGYYKLKFSIHFADGEVYTGRLDLSPREDNPFTTENVIGKHCVDFLEWQIKDNDCLEAKEYLKKYCFDDSFNRSSDLKAVASEWLMTDNTQFSNLVVGSGYTSQELHATISKVANNRLESTDTGSNPLEIKYTDWVQKKINQGQASKIISFDDWLDIHSS